MEITPYMARFRPKCVCTHNLRLVAASFAGHADSETVVALSALQAVLTCWLLLSQVSLRPLYEVLVQLMCHRVPHELKAALMRAIAVFALSPDASAEMWERITATAIFEVRCGDVL